ncbi:MAG: hypothetical protein WBV31_08975, partial [Terriglobales bacterium]
MSDGLSAVSGCAEQGDAAGRTGEKAAQTLRDETKDLFAGGASLEKASEFADLGDFGSLLAGIVEESADSLVR